HTIARSVTKADRQVEWNASNDRVGSDSVVRRYQINVRFRPLCGLKSDISRGPKSAIRGREQSQQSALHILLALAHRPSDQGTSARGRGLCRADFGQQT